MQFLSSKNLLASLGLVGVCAASAASAAGTPTGTYVSAGIGGGVTDLDKGGINSAVGGQGVQVSSGTADKQDTSFNLNVGYRLSPNFAVEGGYVNLGKYGYQMNLAGSAGSVTGEFKSQGITAAGVGILPLGNGFSAYGKLGLIDARTELVASPSNSASGVTDRKHSSVGMLAGLGASYDITPKVAVLTEWNRYARVGDASTGDGAVNAYSVGFRYTF